MYLKSKWACAPDLLKQMFLTVGLMATSTLSQAATVELIVQLTGIDNNKGDINCALFADSGGFPMEAASAVQTAQVAPSQEGASCRFSQLDAGYYAVAVSHDENRNGVTDTNFFGIPKEAWGVSNNVRPAMRAPTFEEARFALPSQASFVLDIELD